VRMLAPVVGGLLADRVGYGSVFVTASVAGLLSILATLRVTDPRQVGKASKTAA